MTAQQCIAARKTARRDERYSSWRKDSMKRSQRLQRQIEGEKKRSVKTKK